MDQTIRKPTKRTPGSRHKSKKRQKTVQPIYVLSPDRTGIGTVGTFFGMIGRALIPFVGTLGLILFVYDAFMLEIPVWQPALFSAFFTLLFTVCSLGIIPCIASLGVTALGLGAAALIAGKSPQFLILGAYNSVITFINGIMARLNLVGYRSIGALKLKDLPGMSADKLIEVDYSQYYLAAACAMI